MKHLAFAMAILVWCAGGGCAGAGEAGPRPAGFTLAVSVWGHDAGAWQAARYVLESDLILRGTAGRERAARDAGFPPQVRRLSPQEMDRLWELVEAAGLLDDPHPGVRPPPAPVLEEAESAVAVFEVRGNFRPRVVVVDLEGAEQRGAAAGAVIEYLHRLAWIE